MEKDIPWKSKGNWRIDSHIRQTDLKIKAIIREKEGHYKRTKGLQPRVFSPRRHNNCKYLCTNMGACQYIRQTLTDIKGEINSDTIIVGDFNTPLTPMDRSVGQKINKETQAFNDTLDQMNLVGISRTFHSNVENYTSLSRAQGTFSKIDYILGQKSSFGKFNKIEICQASFLTTL